VHRERERSVAVRRQDVVEVRLPAVQVALQVDGVRAELPRAGGIVGPPAHPPVAGGLEGERPADLRVPPAEAGEGVARLAVEDQGPGVPVAERERIWQPYHRLARDRKAAGAGTGLGLSVVAELAGLLRGRAWVEDAAGGGARFVVEIPVAAEARG